MNMDDNKKKLYDALSEEYDMGTFEQFCSDINDDEKRKKLYDATINEYDFGDYDSFSKQLLGDRYGAKIQDAVDPKNVVHPEWEQQSYSPNPEILTDGYLPKSLNLAANPANLGTLQAGDKEGKEVLNESGEQVKPENLSISNWPGEEEEYVEGFGEGLKQGWQGLKEGAKFFAGETANLFSGSSLDDERALATLERLQAEGKTDYIDGSGNTYVADKRLRADLKLIREAIQEAGGDMDKAKRILSERAADKSWGDSMMESAKEGMNAMKPTKGFGAWVGNLVPQMIPSAAAIALSFVTKNPKYAQMVGGIGMGGMTASTAGQSMKEARDAGATNGEVWAVGIADGVIEYATEKLPFDNYTRKLFNGVKHKVGGEMAEAANYVSSPGRAELEELLTKANKKLGGRLFNGKNVKDYLASIAEEGLSEFTAEALQTITPMIYENPENYPVLTDILSSGWEGAKAGLFMGSVLGGASKIAEHRQQRARRQEQGFVDVAQVHLQDEKGSAVDDVVEVVGKDKESGDLQVLHEGVLKSVKKDDVVEEHRFSFEEFDNAELNMEADESYQNGYSLKTPQEMSDAQNMYEFQRKRLSEQLGVEPDAMDEYIVDPINFIKEQRQLGASDEDIRSILDYSNAKQTYEGMIQRVRDDIDDAVGQAASIVQMRTNRDTGMVQGATMKLNDRRVYVVSGNVVQYTDGKGIDHANSDNSIIIRDAETNEIEMVSPDVLLSVDAPLDANELLMQEEQAISEQIAREAADKMEGKVTAWNEGDTYTITDDNGQHVQVRLVANELSGLVDNGDGTVNATVDGKTIIEIPKEQIQQAVDEANMARVASYAATNEAKEVEEKTAATLPEYGFNYKVTLQSKDGEEITGTIGDVYDDEVLSGGEREFVVNIDELSSSINGKRSPKLTLSELNDMVVSVQDADGNLVWQREDLATEAAENVTKGAEGVPENTENVPENAENVQNNGRKSDEAGERTDNNGIVMKDDGSPDLAASGALNALGFLRERYKEEAKVQRKIETTRDYYGKELEKVQKVLDKAQQEFDDAPFGFEDKAEAKLQKAQQDYDAVKREVDLWTELYNMLIADRVKENSEVVSEIEDMGEPLNGEELAAMMLINGQIHLLREDYLRETGYSNQEANKLFGLFRSKENGGVTVEQAGEMVMLADNEDGTHFFDEADANAGRNAVLEVLSLVHTPSDLRDYIKNRREQQAQRELEAEREYYENMIERDFHMTLEEYEDYVYLLSKENPFEDIDVAEIDAIFAEAANEYEEFFKQQEYEQGRTDEFIEGGNDVLPEERADDSPGTEEGEGSRETEGAGSGTAGKDGTSSGYDGREVTEESSVQPTVQAQIDAAEAETDTNPTDAQKEAGNYKKGHVQVGTFDISIEQPKGSVRSGVDANGKKWETKMANTYGYIRGTEGVDGDHIDVFLANDVDAWNGRKVFVVDQYNEDGSFDEHKVMLGFNEQEEAEGAYFANYDKDWPKKHKTVVAAVNLEDFEKWIQSSHRKTKAFAEYKNVKVIRTDHQGNPVNADGSLLLEKIGSINELTDEDFLNASRSVQLPSLPERVDEAIGANGKPVVIKKNIFEKNRKSHKDVSPAQSREILLEALYKPTMYGQNQKTKRPYNWILIHNAVKHSSVVLEVNHNKDNVEIVNWHYLEDDTLEQKKRQAINEGGLILTLESAAGNTINGLSSESKDNKSAAEKQVDGTKSSEAYSITPAQYTTKKGKVLDMQLVTPNVELTKDEFRSINALVKSLKGWFDAKQRGFMMRSEEDARKLVEHALSVVDKHDSPVNDTIEYRYRLTIRPFSIGTQPDSHLRHEDDGSPYGVVVYDHPLTRQEAENFSLTPLTEAKELEGKNFEVPFGKGVLKYQVRSVDENGRVKFLINGEHERSLPYYRFLDEIGDKAKELAEEAHHDATEKQHAREKSSAEIEAAWKKRIDDYIKEHYPAISERSENGMAQRIASYKDKVLTEMRDNAELEITAMKEEEGVFGERVPVVSGEFPKGLPEYKVITKKQKGGKRTVAENVYVAMVNGDLYVKRYVRGGDLKNISVRIPGAKKYDFNEIKYRLDLGIGTSTDAVRLMGDAIDELYKRGDFQESIFEKAERIAREAEEKKRKQAKSARDTHHVAEETVSLEKWKLLNGEERMQEAGKHPLLREEIENASTDDVLKTNALDYLNGNQGMIQSVSYLKVYEDVRYTNRTAAADSGATDSTQLDTPASGNEQRVDVRDRGQSGNSNERMDRGTGEDGVPAEGGPLHADPSDAGGFTAGIGNASSEPLPVRGSVLQSGDSRSDVHTGSSVRSGEGRNVGGRTGRKSDTASRKNSKRGVQADTARNAKDDRGLDSNDSLDKELADAMKEFDGVLDEFKRAGKEELSMSIAGMSSRQMEVLPRLIAAGAKVGYTFLKKGVHNFAEWAKQMRKMLGGKLADAGLSENEIDSFITEMWKCKLPIDGEVHTLEEWASIIGKAELRKKVGESLEEKRKAQAAAEPVAVKVCDRNNIAETLPFLLPQQREDVMKAETQFFDDSHNDRDHAFGKGYMFTNGTGTGKTYTGLGIVKRFIKQGKGRILILTPSQTKVKDWVDDAKNLGIELNDLDAVAKAKKDGATATTEKGEGAVITTYANFRQNKALLEDLFDLIVYDESHRLLENKDGIGTAGSLQHYKLSNRNKNYSYLRLQEINPVWNDYQAKIEEFDAEREKLIERLKKEYGIANELALGQRGGLPPALNGNWTGDIERKFPELAKLRNEVNTLGAKYEKEIKPKLEEEAKANMKHTKVVFLSATPFNTRENLDYAEGYIFSYPENDRQVGYANQSPRSQFYLEHFGAGYRWRYNRLESSSSNAAAVSKQEVEFSDYLQHALQTMSGRVIDSPYDYSRDFPTVTMEKAETFNSAMEELSRDEATSSGYREVMGDYNYTSALFESMKVSQIIPRLKAHLERGRKVVIFHRRVDSREPLRLPFAAIFAESARLAEKESDAQEKAEKKKRIASLKRKYADLLAWEQGLDLRMPREQLADAFGKDDVLFFSGKEGEKAKKKAVKDFNSDTSGKNIMVIQEASGKEGISLHDTTGVHQRVLVTLALPQSPITALQIEGRIYRIGNKSNAIFEYPLLGLNAEMMLFGQKFNEQVSTTENLALGSQARNLRESFARGVEEHSVNVDIDGQGVGGKELDAPSVTETDAFDRAVLDYYTNQKLAGRRDSREGQDYYPTPEPLGYMMNQWGQIGEGESVLEPSAGHGAIARYVPKENLLTAVEPSQRLFSKLQIKAGGNGRKFENDVFENYNVVNKHDVVLMNPPFGVGGRMAVDHVAKAFQHLDEGGRVVAIIPRGSTDKKFEKWYEGQKDAVLTAEIGLPDITFERAGTSVNCRVVVIDKVTNKDLRGDAASRAVHMDLSGMHFDKIEDFFEEIRDIRVPERTIDHKAKMKKKATPVARELRGMKGIKKVELNEERIFVDGRGVWASLQWGDWQGDALTRHLANEYARFRKSEEYAADRENNIQIEVYGELKELCCKLAGLTEDEMQRYIERSGKDVDEDLYREDDDLEEVNERFNEQLESLTEENAQGVILDLGRPGDILLSAGLSDREIRLYGNKVMKKIRKHGFAISSIKNLPVAINHPIAVFNNYGNEMNRAILTELKTPQGNVLATIEWGKGTDAELNIVTSVFGKGKENVIGWINKGYATYISKEKALDYLRIPAPIAGAQDTQELSSATKIVKEFENPSIDGEDLYREVTDDSELAWLENQPTVKAYRAMQVIDGRLYSPMASGKKKNLGAGYGLNKWDVATEMAFNVTDEMLEEVEKLNQSDKRGYVEVIPGKLRFVKESKSGKASLKFHLVTDETDVWAAYNPYNHNSDSMLNDQFKAAYRRGNIVVVEAEVPVGDLESGYQAPYSKDAVGKTEWKSGDVAAQFPDEMKRTVYLSRYTKPVRVLSNAEVAKWIGDRLRKAEQLTGKPITLYEASFHPEVKRLLEADGFTFVPVEQPKGKVSKVLEGHPDYMSDDKIAQINEALSQEDSWLQRGGDGSFSDEELSYENDPIAKWLGESGRSEKQKHAYAEKARTRMANRVNELAEQLHLDNVEVVTDVSTLEGRKARAKGWFSPKTGKIVVVIPNHKSIADVEQTVLHEAVAHYGLRKLFGKHFDDFLWNVYNNASEDVRRKIAGLAAKRGWDFPKATEEYLASLAEDTDFENAANSGWFSKIKFFFLKMLAKAGVKLDVELGDNELRYILWRSYENMAEPGRYRGVIEQAADIAKQYELGVGNYANGSSGQQHVADEVLLLEEQSLSDAIDDFTSKYNSAPIEIIHNDISVDELMNLFNVDEGEAREMQEDIQSGDAAGGYSSKFKKIIIFADTISGEYEATLFHENIHAVLDDMYGIQGKKIVDSYYKAASDRFPKLRDAVVSNYDSEEIAEEFFTYMLSYSMVDGYFDKITPYLTETQNSELLKILESIGYEQKSEIKERTNRRLGREVRESDSEGNKGKRAVRLRKIKEYLSKLTSDESDIFFREGEPEGTSSGADGASGGEVGAVRSATELYEEGVANTLWNRLKEGWVDYLRSAQQLQEAIEKAAGEKIADFENVYLHALHKSSVDNREWMAMMKKYVEPLNDVIHEITHGLKATFRGGKITLDVIETYLNCKHGLERNDKFAMRDAEERVKVRIAKADKALAEELRDAEKLRNRDLRKLDRKRMDGRVDETAYRQAVEAVKAEYEKDVKQAQDMRDKQVAKIEKKLNEYYKENRERDYSGLTEIFDPKVKGVRKGLTVEELERLAQAYVDDFEAAVGAHFVGKLWDKVREMNRFSLRKSYETGLISRDSYKRTLDMFSYYVPLRGFDGEKAADVYDYITEGTISVNEVLKHAKGRTSRAANLIATMMNMGNSAITQGNKNQVKNRLLNLANNHDTGGLLTVSNQWYEKVGEDEWMPAQEPSFKEGMTAEEMRSVVEDYEERMKEREALGEVKRMKNGVHLNVRLDSKRKEYEHGVKVKRNGTEYVVWVNGNPKAAQAINGLLNPEMKHGFVLDNLRRLGRFVSKNVTAFNPEFLLRNIKRDVLSASMVGYSKYGADYVKRFEWHVKNNVSMVDVKGARAGKFSGIYDLYHRYEKGALDMSVQRERWFKEFIENGGETGYSQVWSIEDYQREIKKQMKRHRADSQTMQAVAAVGAGVEFLNRGVENVCRFAAYCASRESGMNVLESVRDAKEASVNFNKKGSGALGNAGAKALFMFLNPSVQGFVQQLVLTKKYPKRMLPVLGAQIALGAIAVLLAQWVGDDDEDEDDYFNLNSHVRRSNFILRVGDHEYLRWDLPPDLRPWYGLGEIGASALAGKMKYENVPLAVLTNFSQMLPLDPVNDKALVNDDENLMKGVFKNILRGTGVGSWADAYLFDEDFMGRQITGATEWNKLDPEWKRAGRNTSGLMIYLSKLANEATGGDDATSGWLNFNPSKLEYALKGTLGGWVDFPVSFCKGCEAFFSDDPDEKLDTRNYPIIGDTYIRTDNSRMRHTQVRSAYQWYKHEHDVFEHKLKTYNREVYEGGLMEYAEKVKNLYESAAYYRFLLVDGYMKEVNSVYSAMKQAEDEKERKDLEAYVDYLKAEMVKKLEQKEAEDGGMADAEETTGK